MTAVCIYSEQPCECCGGDLKVVAVPGANPDARMGVRCTNCPAGGDILKDGTTTGPALEGAHGAQASVLTNHTPEQTADSSTGEMA